MVNVADIMITSLETITAFKNSEFRWVMDELQNATIATSEDKVDITGKKGRKLNSMKRNKAVTISGTNGIISAGLLETQTGGKFEVSSDAVVMFPDHLVVSVVTNEGTTTTTAKTQFVATGTTGSEIIELRLRNEDGTLGEKFVQSADAPSTKKDATATAPAKEATFNYDPSTRLITFANGAIENGAEIVVYYNREVSGAVLDNKSDSYSEKLELYVDAIGEDKCNNVYHVQFHIPKADFDGNFEIAMGDDQTVHAFQAESLSGACGAAGNLWTYTVFGVNQTANA